MKSTVVLIRSARSRKPSTERVAPWIFSTISPIVAFARDASSDEARARSPASRTDRCADWALTAISSAASAISRVSSPARFSVAT
jgi:hypothetical protein